MRHLSILLATTVASTLSSAAAFAQATVIGLGFDPAAANIPAIIQQTLCQPGNRVCQALGFANALPAPWAGGSAYNGRNESVWTTDGLLMVETRIAGCQVICRMPAARQLGAASFAGGLEISPGLGLMYQVESLPGAAALHIWNIAVCPPVAGPACQFPLPSAAHTCGGVAIDEVNGEIYYAVSDFAAAVPANFILGARLSNPCNILCRLPIQGCGTVLMRALRGLCFDECRQTMLVTDGNQTLSLRRTGVGPCAFAPVACCPASPQTGPYGWVGIDIEPQHAQPVGTSCLGPNCLPCPNMALGTQGDPVLGNPTFQLALSGAPLGTVVAIGLSPGACNNPGFPIFCGQWHPGLGGTVFLPAVPVAGAGPCQGAAQVPLPIPTNFALCGAPICFEGLLVCLSTSGPGVGLTNAVEIVLN